MRTFPSFSSSRCSESLTLLRCSTKKTFLNITTIRVKNRFLPKHIYSQWHSLNTEPKMQHSRFNIVDGNFILHATYSSYSKNGPQHAHWLIQTHLYLSVPLVVEVNPECISRKPRIKKTVLCFTLTSKKYFFKF